MIVLGYILNDTKRFRTFVANKVKKITDNTKKKQWKYVNTHSNPADHASRGISAADTEKANSWLSGAQFLWQPEETWNIPEVEGLPDDDPELLSKKTIKCNTTKVDKNEQASSLLTTLEESYSCWHYILIILVTILKFVARCRKKHVTGMITVKEMQHAKLLMLKMIQAEAFGEELIQLVPKGRLASLNPFIDEDSIL